MKFLCLLIILIQTCFASKDVFESITYGNVNVGQARIKLKTSDFAVFQDLTVPVKIQARLISKTVEWVRVGDILLRPRARIKIKINGYASEYNLTYEKKNILLNQRKGYAEAVFYVSLFQSEDIYIYKNEQPIGSVYILSNKNANRRKRHHIDYSCMKYKIEITGLEDEFLSVGCRENIFGKMGREKVLVELFWTTADFSLANLSKPPYMATFVDDSSMEINVTNRFGETKKVMIRANVPPRYKRLKTALGFGPYAYYSSESSQQTEIEVLPAFMVYAKFDLDSKNSIRAFDALVYKDSDSYFNNPGVYYANDVAEIMDKRLVITTLLGFQSMQFKFNKDTTAFNQFIFPQGIEILYKHAFGIDNYIFSYGMFLSPSDKVKYNNLWIRWGKKYFWEINYIDWGYEDKYAKTWGLSIGIPFMQFF